MGEHQPARIVLAGLAADAERRTAADADDDVDGEGEGGDAEADRVGREVGERQPEPGDERARSRPRARVREPGRAVSCCAVAAGVTSSAKTSSAPVICAVAATARPSSEQEGRPRAARDRHAAARATAPSTEAKSSGRPTAARTRSAASGDPEQRQHLAARDAEEGPEQQRLEAREQTAVEADEQEAERRARTPARCRSPPIPASVAAGSPRREATASASAPRAQNAEVADREREPGERCAAAAPGKAITARVWPAKVWRRSTMNQPTRRASTATIVPASRR